jgi:tetratricopeptide (TPR) repeat protein
MDRDPESAIEHARQALAVSPSYIDALNWSMIALFDLGHYEDAIAAQELMIDLDPLTIIGRANYAKWLSDTGRIEEAHDLADELIGQSPWIGYRQHSMTSLFYEGRIAKGLSWALEWDREEGGDTGNASLAFAFVGEYDEARRLDDSGTFYLDAYEGRYDRILPEAQRTAQDELDNDFAVWAAAEFLYAAGRMNEALPLLERLLALVPYGRPISSPAHVISSSNEIMMRLAHARRRTGDEDAALVAAQIAKQDHAAIRIAGEMNQYQDRTEAMIAAFEEDPDRAIAALKSALQRGLRDPLFLDDPIFENTRDDPRFVALQDELDKILAAEHVEVLQLICFNNPVPDHWQPMPETCEGVIDQQTL